MRLSDEIEAFLLEMLERQSQVELRRSLLAERFSCSPSQINYVLATRFSPEQGYRVESRRGGGGFVRLVRISRTRAEALEEVLKCVGPEIDGERAAKLLRAAYRGGLLPRGTAQLMLAAVSVQTMEENEQAARLRAAILKNMLRCAAREAEQNAL